MNKYFNEQEINYIIKNDKVNNYSITTLNDRCEEMFEYFINKGIEIGNIKKMILDFPRILTYSLDLLKDKYDSVESLFNKFTNKIFISNPRIFSRNSVVVKDRFNYFISLGINEKKIKKMLIDNPALFTIGELGINISINNLLDKIIDRDKVIKLIASNSKLLSYSNKTINDKFNWFYEKGYTKEETANLVCKAETILMIDYGKNNICSNIDSKYKYLSEKLKYTREEIIIITTRFPEFYTLNINTIKDRINNLKRLGFNDDIIKNIVYKYPQIISFKIDTLNEKYNYYLNLNMLNIFIDKPIYLMQSIELTDCRYKYLISKGIEVNNTNYGKLFMSSKRFNETYGIENEKKLEIYRKNGGNYEQTRNIEIKKRNRK